MLPGFASFILHLFFFFFFTYTWFSLLLVCLALTTPAVYSISFHYFHVYLYHAFCGHYTAHTHTWLGISHLLVGSFHCLCPLVPLVYMWFCGLDTITAVAITRLSYTHTLCTHGWPIPLPHTRLVGSFGFLGFGLDS